MGLFWNEDCTVMLAAQTYVLILAQNVTGGSGCSVVHGFALISWLPSCGFQLLVMFLEHLGIMPFRSHAVLDSGLHEMQVL